MLKFPQYHWYLGILPSLSLVHLQNATYQTCQVSKTYPFYLIFQVLNHSMTTFCPLETWRYFPNQQWNLMIQKFQRELHQDVNHRVFSFEDLWNIFFVLYFFLVQQASDQQVYLRLQATKSSPLSPLSPRIRCRSWSNWWWTSYRWVIH